MSMVHNIDTWLQEKTLPVILLIEHTKNEEVNKKIRTVAEYIIDKAKNEVPNVVKFALYIFDSKLKYNSEELSEYIDLNVEFTEDEVQSNVCDLTNVFSKLNEKMSREKYFNERNGYAVPIICLLLSGQQQYFSDNMANLATNNKWYRLSTKCIISAIKFESADNNLSRDFVDYRYIYHVDEILSSTEYNDFIYEVIQPVYTSTNPIPCSSGSIPYTKDNAAYSNTIIGVDPVENEYIDDWLTDDVYWSNEDWN